MPGRSEVTLDRLGRFAVHVVLVAAALLFGGWPPAVVASLQLVVIAALSCWMADSVRRGTLAWRPTAADLPLALLIALVTVQLAVGNQPLASWALGPPGTRAITGEVIPAPVFALGTIAPGSTWHSLLLFATFVGLYVAVVNLFTRRRHVEALVRTLLVTASVLAVAGLIEYFGKEAGILHWREHERRVVATFTNADHFAAWLNMVAFLGIGQLLAADGTRDKQRTLKGLSLTESFEALGRRYARVIAIVVIAVAIVFTLSRGAILSFIGGLVAVIVIAAAIGRARRTLAAVGVLLSIALAYGVWLGLGPFLSRFQYGDLGLRWEMARATVPMIRDFPILGIGLGAFQDISPRYQTPALEPGMYLLNHAHNDWLQLLVELGPVGAALGLYAVVRVARDLIGVHLLGRGTCPAGGGEQEWARRNDPFSVGIALGAVGGLVTLAIHSAVDFSVRLPANGLLAATLLAVATVALHTRFGTQEGWLAAHWSRTLDARRPHIPMAVGLAAALVLAVLVLRPAVADVLVGRREASPALVDLAVAVAANDVPALLAQADARLDHARRLLTAGALIPGQPVAPLADRHREAGGLLADAIDVLRRAATRNPTNPLVHERLGWAYQAVASIDTAARPEHAARALAHMQRAVALDPQNAARYHAVAQLVVAAYPSSPIDVGLRAGRLAVERKPDLLPDLVYQFLVAPLTEAQWASLVPETVGARVVLADLLEQRGLAREAVGVYRSAAELATPADVSVTRWLLARALMRQGDSHAALRELGAAARVDADNAEIYFATAQALEMTRDAAALEMYRVALVKGEERARRFPNSDTWFRVYRPPLGDVVAKQLGPPLASPSARYRRALALHLAQRDLVQQALKEAEIVLADVPRDPIAHFARGIALQSLGKMDDAVEALRTVVAVDADTRFRVHLARLLRDTKQPRQAINEWLAVLAAEPANLEAALAVARTWDQLGSSAEAMQAYERVYRMAPDNTEARRALARFGWIER